MPIQHLINQQVCAYTSNVQNHLYDNARKYLPTAIREHWRQIVDRNIIPTIDAEHDTFDDVYQKLEDSKIKGVGSKTLIETAAQICYDKDICPDDNCWCMCVNTPHKEYIVTELKQNRSFAAMAIWQKIDFLLKHSKALSETTQML